MLEEKRRSRDGKRRREVAGEGERRRWWNENQKKWKEFLLNTDIQCKFIEDLVYEMKAMVKISSN